MSASALQDRTAPLYERVKTLISPIEWPVFAEDIGGRSPPQAAARYVVILAHNYMTPEIFHCVADIVGDSLALAREAVKTDAKVIVLAGVHFMAETAKLLNPDKTVLIWIVARWGCSLAESITPEDVKLMRQRYPGVPVVTYVNSSAAVKAEYRYLLHLRQRAESRGITRGRHRDHATGRIFGAECRGTDPGESADLGRPSAWCTNASPRPKSKPCVRIIRA